MALDLAERSRALDAVFYRVVSSPAGSDAGIADETVRARLDALAVPASTQLALSLVPLIEVAWADGEIQPREAEAIARAADERGMVPGSPARAVLAAWLETRPGPELLEAWVRALAALVENLTASVRKRLAAELLERARAVAEAAGGFLGLATISDEEEAVLRRLDHAFKFPEQFVGLLGSSGD